MQAYAVCIGVTPECRWTESEMIGDGQGHADKVDEAYHDSGEMEFWHVSSFFLLGHPRGVLGLG